MNKNEYYEEIERMSDNHRWNRKKPGLKVIFIGAACWICISMIVWNLNSQEIQPLPMDRSPLLAPRQAVRIVVQSSENWTDTGYRVLVGQDVQFQASGVISLQKGNPIAFPCSPEGLPMKTVQQAFRDENIGALIGKVVQLVAIEVDEKTGEEKRFEEEFLFYIGAKNKVTMPLSGHLYLGVNELIVVDNDGVFNSLFFLDIQ